MGFWGKASKITGFTMLGVGLAGTAGFGALLGVGANAKYDMSPILEAEMGGGGSTPPGGMYPITYSPAVSPLMAFPKMEAGIGSLNYGEFYINGQQWEKWVDSQPIPSEMKDQFKNSIRDALKLSSKETYSEAVSSAKSQKSLLERARDAIDPSDPNRDKVIKTYDVLIDLYGSIISANDEMIAGAVLVTIFSLAAIISIPLLIVGKKKA